MGHLLPAPELLKRGAGSLLRCIAAVLSLKRRRASEDNKCTMETLETEDIVNVLLQKTFHSLSYSAKLATKERGRPLPQITSVGEGKNRPNDRPRFFFLLLQIKSRPDLTNVLCILSFCPCSPLTCCPPAFKLQ